ncbi:MAG: hypothetical protein EB127_28030 [Alphaproteobacteria bacterium]|nr:hypothetical protein [Alphaproteobacteria bacterium]
MSTIRIPISIGFEFETQFLCPILVNEYRFKGIENEIEELISYQLYSKDNDIFSLYGDAFTETPFSQKIDQLRLENHIYVKELYSRKEENYLHLDRDWKSQLRNAEFINTFPLDEGVALSKLWEHIVKYMKKTVSNIEMFLRHRHVEKYEITTPSFPYSHLYYHTSAELVTNQLKDNQERLLNIYRRNYHIYKKNINNVQRVYPDIETKLAQIQNDIEDISSSPNFLNPHSYRIGFLSRLPLSSISTKARFVCQCTLGFPILFSISIMTKLYSMVKK